MTGLLEIITNKFWMVMPESLHAMRSVLEANLNGHVPLPAFDKQQPFAMLDASCESVRVDGDRYVKRISEPFVNVVTIDGPVTRNGGACSYGSIHHRKFVMEAADSKFCCGHVFVINTPGGAASAVEDYRQAVEYARAKAQPVYALVDGLCASAGLYVAAMCDKRFYVGQNDQVGSVGALCAFYAQKSGEKNTFTNETFYEFYDPESYDKNKWARDVVDKNDSKEIIDELARLGSDFRNFVKQACPKVSDVHLHGRMFAAKDVEGVLVDARSTLGDVVRMCFAANPYKEESSFNNQSMEEKYQIVAAACGVDALVVTAEGTHLVPELLDNLVEKLDADAKAIEAFSAKAAELDETHRKEIDEIKVRCSAEAEALKADVAKAQAALENAQAVIADRDAAIAELTASAAPMPAQSPASNGASAGVVQCNTMPEYDSAKSPLENARIREEWKRANGLI